MEVGFLKGVTSTKPLLKNIVIRGTRNMFGGDGPQLRNSYTERLGKMYCHPNTSKGQVTVSEMIVLI